VIDAFNRGGPYDQFLVEQLAADRLAPVQGRRPLAALGFLTLGGRFMGNFHDVIDDRIDVVCRGLMSLTVSCARCHDHKFDPIPTRDYYSLYGVLAGAREPLIPPEIGEPAHTAVYEKFVRELDARRNKLAEFVAAKHRELVDAAKRRAGEYLLAAQHALDQPTIEDFMLIADGTDLNPAMLIRWQSYLARTRKTRDPVFAPWHALAALSRDEFAARSASLIASFAKAAQRDRRSVNPVIARALAEGRPKSMADMARIYGRELNRVEALRQEAVPELEELRRVFHGAESPAD